MSDALEQATCPISRRPQRSLAARHPRRHQLFLVSGVAHVNSSLHRWSNNPGAWSLEGHADVARLFPGRRLDAMRLRCRLSSWLAAAASCRRSCRTLEAGARAHPTGPLALVAIEGLEADLGAHGRPGIPQGRIQLGAVSLLG